jgi:hypothetical protein
MSIDSSSLARQIAKQITYCPFCAGNSYLAVYENTATGFVLRSVRCERCECDILACFLSLQPADENRSQEQRLADWISLLLIGASLGIAAVIGWLIVRGWGWI